LAFAPGEAFQFDWSEDYVVLGGNPKPIRAVMITCGRNAMSVDATIATMKSLKLHGMAQSIAELSEQASPAYSKAEPILQQLLKAEVAEREVRSIQYQMKVARFPAYRDLTGFDFTQSEVNETLMASLHHCEFMEEAQNVVFVGGPGTGKTHLATAIAVQATPLNQIILAASWHTLGTIYCAKQVYCPSQSLGSNGIYEERKVQ